MRAVAIMCRVYRSRDLSLGNADLARALKVSKPVITRAVTTLEDRGWLKRSKREDDRRLLFLKKTEKGEA